MLPTRLFCTFAGVAVLGMGLVMGSPPASAIPSAEAIDAINHRYADLGGPSSPLGKPIGAAVDVQGGARQNYSGGAIFYSKQTGAKVMYGQILDKYRSLGGPDRMGFPLNDESAVGDDVGRFNDFSQPGGAAIYWTRATGASVLEGKLLDAWRASGATKGPFGYPSADMTEVNGVSDAKFVGPAGTEMRWSDRTGLLTVPSALAASIPGFEAATTAAGTAMPTPGVSVNQPAVPRPKAHHGSRWWPLVIGLGAAAVLASLLARLGRRRGVPTPAPPRPLDTGPVTRVPPAPPAPVAPKAPERPTLTANHGPAKAPAVEPPARAVDLIEQGGKTPPLVVDYDADPAHDIGGIEVTYENNAVGENQQSDKDRSSDHVGHLAP